MLEGNLNVTHSSFHQTFGPMDWQYQLLKGTSNKKLRSNLKPISLDQIKVDHNTLTDKI